MDLGRGASLVLWLCGAAAGCDGVDVEALERRVEVAEEQVQADARTLSELATELEAVRETAAKARANGEAAGRSAKDAAEQVADLQRTVALLEEEIGELETKLEAPPAAAAPVRAGRPDPALRYRVEVGDSAVRGPDDAEVTIVMFSDFQCPFCKRAAGTIRQVEDAYGDEVRIVAKHNPLAFHSEALPAARAAQAAHRQGKFWEMHDLLYENNRDLTRTNFVAWAKKVGCNHRRFERDLDDAEIAEGIAADQRLAKRVGARGTPAFFINGRFLSGAQPFSAFEKVIEEEKAEARRRIADGTSAGDLYRELMRGAKSGV